jgi:hypothetical protein
MHSRSLQAVRFSAEVLVRVAPAAEDGRGAWDDREATRTVAVDAHRIVAKSTERGELPTDPDPIEELLRIVGEFSSGRTAPTIGASWSGNDAGKQRQIPGAVMPRAEPIADGGLTLREAIEVAQGRDHLAFKQLAWARPSRRLGQGDLLSLSFAHHRRRNCRSDCLDCSPHRVVIKMRVSLRC